MEMPFSISDIPVRTAILISLLSAWVLVGLFQYLNRYTRRAYFNVWTAGWLFYALFLVLSLTVTDSQIPVLVMAKNWCLATAAVLILWGSFQVLKLQVAERLIAVTFVFVTLWSYAVSFEFPGELWAAAPAFFLLAFASGFVAWSFFSLKGKQRLLGTGLLTFGFSMWALFLAIYPFLQAPDTLVSAAFVISGVLQLFIATSMIVLVLEEAKQEKTEAESRLKEQTASAELFRVSAEMHQQRFQQLFENANEAIVVISEKDLRIVEVNSAAKRLLKISDTTLETFEHFYAQDGVPAAEPSDLLASLASTSECDLICADGSRVRAEVRGGRVPYQNAHVYQFCFLELTQKARLEQQLRQAERLSALGRLISGVAHELNNPLAAVKGYTDLILAGTRIDSKTRASLMKVAKESDRAARLVKDFLAFARAESGNLEPIDLHDMIRQAVEFAHDDLEQSGVALKLSLCSEHPFALGSAHQLHQVLANLIINARHALTNFKPAPELRISTHCANGKITIKVADNGPGVPEHLLAKIFEPFFTSKPVGTGTGLGLSICHSIIHAHHGRIYCEQSPHQGATFIIELPLHDMPDSDQLDAKVATIDFTESTAPKTAQRLNILIVDDEPLLASLLQEIVELLGHTARAFNSADAALKAMQDEHVDVVFSDYRMPGMNGSRFYQRAIEIDDSFASRFVFITGDVMDDATRHFFESTGLPCVLKPFHISSIEKAIDGICSTSTNVAAVCA